MATLLEVVETIINTEQEKLWRDIANDMLIRVYVPEADQMSRSDALSLAYERDEKATEAFMASVEP